MDLAGHHAGRTAVMVQGLLIMALVGGMIDLAMLGRSGNVY